MPKPVLSSKPKSALADGVLTQQHCSVCVEMTIAAQMCTDLALPDNGSAITGQMSFIELSR